MTLTEWLDRQIDIASAKHDADNSTASVVNINQTMLVDVVMALKFNDARLAAIEAALDLPKFDLTAQGRTVRRNS
ncbi:hypothetical protein E3O55_07310 [Cryobacterium sp. MDB1-18-2]|uniref:hypothetical protein n=1 Tax=unclassified Cryobacterium TaxID=2649013 RepID=UPI00106D535F|nr:MULTISPECIES: hypothetical protein [unclassified Cryobacterium]TFC30784.1 hypothetical protein E3O55_07310 [Cryobacterium sp. MDB1-18-2]TFC38127.1 hypothetical protein E3O50_17030 [Cryobacterium sp. MDB1-18-1]